MQEIRVIKKRYIILIVATMMFSMSYMIIFESYNRMSTDVQRLGELIQIQEGNIENIEIQLVGKSEGIGKTREEMKQIQEELNTEISHRRDCSKLCRKYHPRSSTIVTNGNQAVYNMELINNEESAPYKLTVASQNKSDSNTKYSFSISSSKDIELLDCRRDRLISFLLRQDVTPIENIYFEGKIVGDVDDSVKKQIATKVLNKLGSNINGTYKSDVSETTMAYYGYTKEYDNYISDSNGKRSNVEINFSYDENDNTTDYIVAFPFCNKTY